MMQEVRMPKITTINVADAKRHFADLLGRVAYGGETIIITRHGKPMARLVPVDADTAAPHVADAQGWLEDDDSFFTTIVTIVADREIHPPRALRSADHQRYVSAGYQRLE
jgi:prevent-host-death family protein